MMGEAVEQSGLRASTGAGAHAETQQKRRAHQSGGVFEVFEFLRRCVSGRAAAASLTVERLFSAVALDVHLEDCGVVDEAVDRGERHRLIAEHMGMPRRLIGESLGSR